MAKFLVSEFLVGLGGYRLSQDGMKLILGHEWSDEDISGLEDLVNQHGPGSLDATGSIEGIGSDTMDDAFIESIRTAGVARPLLVAKNLAAALGSPAWISNVACYSDETTRERAKYETRNVSLWQDRAIALGSVAYNWLKEGLITASDVGASLELGELGASQELIACLQILDPPEAAGVGTDLLDVEIYSSALGDFTDKVLRGAFAQFAADADRTAEIVVIDGDTDPVTDEFWRLEWTKGGAGTPSFPVLAGISISPKVATI